MCMLIVWTIIVHINVCLMIWKSGIRCVTFLAAVAVDSNVTFSVC